MSESPGSADRAGPDKTAFDEAGRLLDEGRRLFGDGRFSEAADVFRRAVEVNPHDVEAWQQLGAALGRSGVYEDALKASRTAVELHPHEASGWMQLGWILSEVGRSADALDALDKALQLDPNNLKAMVLKAQVLGQLGEHEHAISLLRRAVELEPKNAEAWSALDGTLRDIGRLEATRSAEVRAAPPESESLVEVASPEERTAPPWVENTADRDNFNRYAERLRWVREQGLRALEDTNRRPVEADWGEILLPAARQLLEALYSTAEDDRLWQILQDRTARLHARDFRKMQEILDQDLAALLVYMGYRPPPPPQVLEWELKESLADVLTVRGDAFVGEARRAQRHLAFFTFRLRRVIDEAAEADPPGALVDKQPRGTFQREGPWRRLRAAVGKATMVAVPAGLAAGLVALVFPPAGPAAAAAGFGSAATAAGQELLKEGTQFAATSLLDKITADEPALATADQQRSSAWKRAGNAVGDLRSALTADEHAPQWAKVVDVFAIECVSALYGLLQVEQSSPYPSHHALPATVDWARDLVNQIRDLVQETNHLSEPELIHQRMQLSGQLASMEQRLREILEPQRGWPR